MIINVNDDSIRNIMKDSEKKTYLVDVIERDNYFQRSVNIDLDKNLPEVIKNFYCPISYEQVLERMIDTIQLSHQSAFTWTGTFGSGKSTLALFLNALISTDEQIRDLATQKLSTNYKKKIVDFFQKDSDWQVVNIVGQAISIETLFKQAFKLDDNLTTQQIFDYLTDISRTNRLLIFIDEMGKLLEAVNRSNTSEDVYFLQQLAEFVNRTEGKIIFIGILHQSFTAYARQSKRHMFNEWQKIQGRFTDLAITLSVDEQLNLISKVIEIDSSAVASKKSDDNFQTIIDETTANVANGRTIDKGKFSQTLENVFPLHPLVAILLCQLSKKNFGQNQRSIFSFLMSAEAFGFSHYLKNTSLDNFKLYQPSQFWDYLDNNLGNMILSSEYAKFWLLSQLAVNRYEVRGDNEMVNLIKIISLISMFADDTGIHADFNLLQSATGLDSAKLISLLEDLQSASLISYSKFQQAYIFNEGSDFNLSEAIEKYLPTIQNLTFSELKQFEPIVAKKHYQEKGAFRWVEIKLLPMNTTSIRDTIATLAKQANASLVGYFCILIPTNEEELAQALNFASELSPTYPNFAFTVLHDYESIIELLKDALAIKEILKNEPRLINDTIARQETEARLGQTDDKINLQLQSVLNQSDWFNARFKNAKPLNIFKLSSLASQIADDIVERSIECNNELVNRNQPSPNAKGAIRELIKRMIENSKEENLGIEKFPPERAVYESVLKNNGLHHSDDDENYFFTKPKTGSFKALWDCADNFLRQDENIGQLVTADQIYQEWQKPPYGVKAGLCDILYVAYILSRPSDLANYINGEYKTNIQYLLAEYLLKDPKDVGIREVSRLKENHPWIVILRDKLQSEFCQFFDTTIEAEPLPIAQAIIKIFFALHPWVHRTNELSAQTKQLKTILKSADDPNKLLFDDLPKFFSASDSDEAKADAIIDALKEMHDKYPDLVSELNRRLLVNFRVIQDSDKDIIINASQFETVNNRANLIWQKSGDTSLEAFIARLRTYRGGLIEAEGLISLLVGNKIPKSWIDADIQKALQRLSDLSFNFLEAEINSDIPNLNDRFQASVILKVPSKTPKAIPVTIDRKAQITPENAKLIRDIVKSIREEEKFKKLDINDKVATISELFKELATE